MKSYSHTRSSLAIKTLPASSLTDAQHASALWKEIQGFQSHDSNAGLAGLAGSDSVRGDYVHIYANSIVVADMKNLSDGSVVVKEESNDDQGALKEIIVMPKIPGFSPTSGDWFSTRFDSVGSTLQGTFPST